MFGIVTSQTGTQVISVTQTDWGSAVNGWEGQVKLTDANRNKQLNLHSNYFCLFLEVKHFMSFQSGEALNVAVPSDLLWCTSRR